MKKIDLKNSSSRGAEKNDHIQAEARENGSVTEEDLDNMEIIAEDEEDDDDEEISEKDRQKLIEEEQEDPGLILFK